MFAINKVLSVILSVVISGSATVASTVNDTIAAVDKNVSNAVEDVVSIQNKAHAIIESPEAAVEYVAETVDKIASIDENVTKVVDNFYVMDYTYDYDINDIVENGYICTADMLFKVLGDYITNGSSSGFACSTFNAVTSEGDYLFGRNFDYMDAAGMLVRTTPSDGYASIGMLNLELIGYSGFTPDSTLTKMLSVLAPYAIVDGINEKGLSIGVLEIEKDPTVQISAKTNINTTSMIRIVLDKAATVEEAVNLFSQYDMIDLLTGGCTYHYQITDAYGNSAIIEYVDNEMKVIYPEQREGDAVAYQCATNFILTPNVDDPDGMGQDRYEIMANALAATNGVLSENDAMNLLSQVSIQDEDLHGYICSTLWSSLYNNSDVTLSLCMHNNYNTVYTFNVNQTLASQLG